MSESESQEQVTPAEDETDNFTVVTSDVPTVEPDPEPEKDAEPENKIEGDADKKDGNETTPEPEPEKDEGDEKKENTSEPEPDKNSGLVKANTRLKGQRAELRNKNTSLSSENEQLKARIDALENKTPEQDDYDSYEDFIRAEADYVRLNKEKEANPEEGQSDQILVNDEFEDARNIVRDAIDDATAKKINNNQDLSFTTDVVISIADTDEPGKLTAYLAENPEKLTELSSMTPRRQAVRVDNILKSIAGDKKPSQKTTTAPEPFVTESGSSMRMKTDSEKSFSEFEDDRNKAEIGSKTFW